jgi:hypothetical protein
MSLCSVLRGYLTCRRSLCVNPPTGTFELFLYEESQTRVSLAVSPEVLFRCDRKRGLGIPEGGDSYGM